MISLISKFSKKTQQVVFLSVMVMTLVAPDRLNAGQDKYDLDLKLLESLRSENLALFSDLLVKGADPNAIFGHEKWEWVMCLSASVSNLDFLKVALKHGGNINLRSEIARRWESSPIHCAIMTRNREGNLDFVLKVGANPNIITCANCKAPKRSPYSDAAISNRYSKVYKMLEAYEIEPQFVEALVRKIEKARIDINHKEFQWRTKVIKKLESLGYAINDPYKK